MTNEALFNQVLWLWLGAGLFVVVWFGVWMCVVYGKLCDIESRLPVSPTEESTNDSLRSLTK